MLKFFHLCEKVVNKSVKKVIGLGEMSGGHLKSLNCKISLERKRKEGERQKKRDGVSREILFIRKLCVVAHWGPALGPPLALSL